MDNGQAVGILHPGEMGISAAATIQNSGYRAYWASAGRSPQTQARAARFNLRDSGTVARLCETCAVIISVCPPHAAEAVAADVVSQGFAGLFVEANAISPRRTAQIAQRVNAAGAAFVDGGIIGGPAWTPGTTRLYLSGEAAHTAAACFAAGPMQAVVIGNAIGKASALKMCYAAYTKGTTALISAILATAHEAEVLDELQRQWADEGSELAQAAVRRATQSTAKAWRFAGEMEEIAATFEEAGLPGGFHLAAADIFRRTAHFKGAPEIPDLEAVLRALLRQE